MNFNTSNGRRRVAISGGALAGFAVGLAGDTLLLTVQKIANFQWMDQRFAFSLNFIFNFGVAVTVPAIGALAGLGLGLLGAAMIPPDPAAPPPGWHPPGVNPPQYAAPMPPPSASQSSGFQE
jgi:hypothetical protein